MTISFHFQLDPNKPDEEKALFILEDFQRAGWDLPKVMVMALLSLDRDQAARFEIGGGKTANALAGLHDSLLEVRQGSLSALDEAHKVLYQVQELLTQLQEAQNSPVPPAPPSDPPPEAISESFLLSLKKVIKPGISLED